MNESSLITKPLLTEKSLQGNSKGKYTFMVNAGVNKSQLKKLLEKLYNIQIVHIQSTMIPLKKRLLKGRYEIAKRPLGKKITITTKDKKPLDVHKFPKKSK